MAKDRPTNDVREVVSSGRALPLPEPGALPVMLTAYHIGAACDMPDAHWAVAPGPDGWGAVIRWQQSDATIAPPEIEIDADPVTLHMIGDALKAIGQQIQDRMHQAQMGPSA